MEKIRQQEQTEMTRNTELYLAYREGLEEGMREGIEERSLEEISDSC